MDAITVAILAPWALATLAACWGIIAQLRLDRQRQGRRSPDWTPPYTGI